MVVDEKFAWIYDKGRKKFNSKNLLLIALKKFHLKIWNDE